MGDSGVAALVGSLRRTGRRPEAGFAGREAQCAYSDRRGEGGGSWGNHWFPHVDGQDYEP